MRHDLVSFPKLRGQKDAAVLKSYCFETPNEGNSRWELPERMPAVIICPGGAYRGGSAKMKEPVALKFMMQGYQAFTLDYGYGVDSAYPLPLLNLARAVLYLKKNAAELRVDPQHIAVLGFSAGGHLSSLYASTSAQMTWTAGLEASPDDLAVQAVLGAYPVLNLADFVRSYTQDQLQRFGPMFHLDLAERDPLRMLNIASPPHFIFACREDKIVRPAATLEFVAKALEIGVPVEFHLFAEGDHGLSTADALSMQGQTYPLRVGLWMTQAVNWLNDLFDYHFYQIT